MWLLETNRSTIDLWLAVSGYCAGAGALASTLVAAILVIGWRKHRPALPWLIVHFAACIPDRLDGRLCAGCAPRLGCSVLLTK
jgi:hypothetical protein